MSKPYRTFKKEKWLFFALSIIVYFVPFIIVTACMFPFMKKADTTYRWALGIAMLLLHAAPFLVGIIRGILAHFPMLDTIAIAFCLLGAFFNFQIFADYTSKFLWVEGVAAISSIIACVFWGLHKKYARYAESIKANVKSGAFKTKTEE